MNNNFVVIENDILNNNNLTNTEKILYARIVNLSNKSEYCFATNEYLANLMNLKTRQIQYCLARLRKYNYISITIVDNQRRIIPTIKNFIKNRDEENKHEDEINNKKIELIDYDWLNESEDNENE